MGDDTSGDAVPEDVLRQELTARRNDLMANVTGLGEHDPAETSNLSFGKRIGDGTTYAVERMNSAYQARTLHTTVIEIDAALQRLDDGVYGRCIACGQPIPSERLAALPWAALCVPCSDGGSRRRR